MKSDKTVLQDAIHKALELGADSAEVYQKISKRLSVEAKIRKADALETSKSVGFAVRIIKGGRLGFSYTNNAGDLDKVVEAALESSRYTGADPCLVFPTGGSCTMPEIFDPAIYSIGAEEALDFANAIESGALEEKRVTKVRKASASFTSSTTSIINSLGVSCEYSSTSATAHVMSVAEDAGESQMGWDFSGSRFLRDVDFRLVGQKASMRAARQLGARRISASKIPVLLENTVSAEFLGIFAGLLSADAVQKGKSLLARRLGEMVISDKISIIDDGWMAGKLGSRPTDDEGVPTTKKSLIENGVLKTYLHNSYTACKQGIASTGNAVRGSFAGVPSVGALNLYIDSASKVSDALKALGTGLMITDAMGLHTANPVSGDFSVGVSGLWVEDGEIKYPVKEAVLSGNILGLFMNIEAIGGDLEFFGSVGAPSIVFGPLDISA